MGAQEERAQDFVVRLGLIRIASLIGLLVVVAIGAALGLKPPSAPSEPLSPVPIAGLTTEKALVPAPKAQARALPQAKASESAPAASSSAPPRTAAPHRTRAR